MFKMQDLCTFEPRLNENKDELGEKSEEKRREKLKRFIEEIDDATSKTTDEIPDKVKKQIANYKKIMQDHEKLEHEDLSIAL